jgi:hypothetical protein
MRCLPQALLDSAPLRCATARRPMNRCPAALLTPDTHSSCNNIGIMTRKCVLRIPRSPVHAACILVRMRGARVPAHWLLHYRRCNLTLTCVLAAALQAVVLERARAVVPFAGETEARAAYQAWPMQSRPPLPEPPVRRAVPFTGAGAHQVEPEHTSMAMASAHGRDGRRSAWAAMPAVLITAQPCTGGRSGRAEA